MFILFGIIFHCTHSGVSTFREVLSGRKNDLTLIYIRHVTLVSIKSLMRRVQRTAVDETRRYIRCRNGKVRHDTSNNPRTQSQKQHHRCHHYYTTRHFYNTVFSTVKIDIPNWTDVLIFFELCDCWNRSQHPKGGAFDLERVDYLRLDGTGTGVTVWPRLGCQIEFNATRLYQAVNIRPEQCIQFFLWFITATFRGEIALMTRGATNRIFPRISHTFS